MFRCLWVPVSLRQVATLHRTLIDTELLGNRLDAHALGAQLRAPGLGLTVSSQTRARPGRGSGWILIELIGARDRHEPVLAALDPTFASGAEIARHLVERAEHDRGLLRREVEHA